MLIDHGVNLENTVKHGQASHSPCHVVCLVGEITQAQERDLRDTYMKLKRHVCFTDKVNQSHSGFKSRCSLQIKDADLISGPVRSTSVRVWRFWTADFLQVPSVDGNPNWGAKEVAESKFGSPCCFSRLHSLTHGPSHSEPSFCSELGGVNQLTMRVTRVMLGDSPQ
eukprot:s1051_g14.t1